MGTSINRQLMSYLPCQIRDLRVYINMTKWDWSGTYDPYLLGSLSDSKVYKNIETLQPMKKVQKSVFCIALAINYD